MSGPGNEFLLPDVGEGLDQAEIVEWLVAEGDHVARDQPLVEILTDKSQTQLSSPKSGVISRLGFSEGDMAEVGQVLVEFEAESADPETAEPETADPETADPTVATPAFQAAPRRAKAAPAVRRRALEMGLDLAAVKGSGPGGRITVADLEGARPGQPVSVSAAATPSQTTPSQTPPLQTGAHQTGSVGQIEFGKHPLRGIRRVTAEAMERSWQVPHIHGTDELDATNLLSGRKRIKALHPEAAANLTPLAFFVAAVADALRRFPIVNAQIVVGGPGEAGHIEVHQNVNIGIAVSTEAGLIVPVIQNADQRSLFDLANQITQLSRAARDRTITTEELRNGTCTVTNYGSLGGRFATPIIRSPEAAIVGFGSIRERPFVRNGKVTATPTLPIAVGADHRLIDGDVMTAFQEHIIGLLTDPVALVAR